MLKKIYRYLIKKIFGKCYLDGHRWRMHKGWTTNPDWEPEQGFHNPRKPMTLPWIYYECKRCGAHGEKPDDK